MKHYMDIKRLQVKIAEGFEKGDHIIVQEKIDGSNFSIKYDAERDVVAAFSRKEELEVGNNLRGAWEWSQKLDKELIKKILGNNYVLFGEWLVRHTINYPADKYQNAYFFDVYDTERETYLDQNDVKNIVDKLGLNYVPVFYDGEFVSWEHLMEFVGKTDMGCEEGEGIVVKNMTKLNDPNNRFPFYTKIVGEKFVEKNKVRQVDPAKLAERERTRVLAESIVTEARVRKLVHKLVDEGIIPEDWDEEDMKTIARNIGSAVYYDCVKEEPDVVEEVGSTFGKLGNSIAMKIVRQMLETKRKNKEELIA